MARLLKAAGIALVLVFAIVLARTFLHTPQADASGQAMNIPVDADKIAAHLSEAIRFRTVSYQDDAERQQDQFDGFIAWVKATYPEVDRSLALIRLNDTLLFKWAGSEADLPPILVTGHYDVVPVIPGTESAWQHPPFDGVIADGVIWGRGALDDKSAVVAILEATTVL
ncbi:MAG: M20/M25/M40 family metallo-hydrolase, partial [Pseudomonadales bacterium]|nr:M20/M25/M40 family metallo-hydrolase [Pseudomonadales bacterium]